jgi:CNT family concentrative nucleoside transporter
LVPRWWIASVVLHRDDKNWIIPFLFWLAIMLRLVFFYVPITIVTKPMHFVWDHTGVKFVSFIPEKMRIPSAAALTIAVIIIGAFASEESADNTRANRAVSLFGLVVFLFCFYITSRNRKKIVWHTVIVGMLVQFIIALFVLRTKAGYDIFTFISDLARQLLEFAKKGVAFLTTDDIVAENTYFFFSVLPAIIFFVAFVQVGSFPLLPHVVVSILICAASVLLGYPSMVHWKIRSLLLLVHAGIGRGSCCRLCLPLHRARRVGHVD